MKWVGMLKQAMWPTKEDLSRDFASIQAAAIPKPRDPKSYYRELIMADLEEVPLTLRIYRVETTKDKSKVRYIYMTAEFEGYENAVLYLRLPPSKFSKLLRLFYKRSSNAAKNYLRGALYETYFIGQMNKKQRELFVP